MRKTSRRHGNEKTIKDRTRNEEDNSRNCSMQHRPHQGGDNPIPKQEWRRRGDATKLSTKPAACEGETSSMVTTQIRTRLPDVDDVHHLPSIPHSGYGIPVHRSDRTTERNQCPTFSTGSRTCSGSGVRQQGRAPPSCHHT
jgi:hypothetical protein